MSKAQPDVDVPDECGYRGCEAPPTLRIHTPSGRRPIYACDVHGPPWAETLGKFDNRQSAGTTVRKIRRAASS